MNGDEELARIRQQGASWFAGNDPGEANPAAVEAFARAAAPQPQGDELKGSAAATAA